ncbi:hypothetical protein Leryth_010225 [Lithospermum erythrorhizon]|nr:hypothetical protein Leryth_010225 [Lithospermum erythrorhizon]
MESYSRKGDKGCPQLVNFGVQKGGGSQLLNLMAEREWNVKRGAEEKNDEEKLELSLGLPGGDWINKSRSNKFSKIPYMVEENCPLSCGCKFKSSLWSSSSKGSSSFLQLSVSNKESSQPCCNKVVELQSSEIIRYYPVSAEKHR